MAGHGRYLSITVRAACRPQGGPAPGVAASGVRFQASGRSQAVWTSRCTPFPDQLLADTLTQPP